MGFKMGSNKGMRAQKGNIRNKFKFKIIRKDLQEGIQGEANNDGTIFINKDIPKDCALEKKVIKHEKKHMEDMQKGKLGYDDDSITWNGKKYERKNGKINYKGKWMPEGSKNFPWEKH
jgi:hypothetical protein